MVYIYAFLGRLLLYPYLMYRTSRLLPERWCRAFYLVLIVEFLLSTLSLALHSWIMHPVMSAVMSINLFIFFSIGYASAVVIGANIVKHLYLSISRQHSLPLSARHRRRLDWGIALAATLAFCVSMYVGYHSVRYPRVVYRTLAVGDATLADSTDAKRLRIALLTDLHIGEGITLGYVERAVDLTLAQHPDLILVGGDYIDHYSKYAYEPRMMQAMRRLTAPEGVYYVPGNHEYRADSTAKLDWVHTVGGILLRDSIVYPRGDDYALIGRDDYVQTARAPLASLVAQLRPTRATILLEHTPQGLEELIGTPIDLALYGHTHGGQLFPNQIPVWLRYGIVSGSKRVGDTEVYLSCGIGAAGAPYRLGTRSEIIIYDLLYK